MLRLFGHTKIDFIAPRWIFFTLSSILLISSAVIFVQKKDSAYGIDFVGGQIQEFRFKDPVSADSVRTALSTAGLENAIIQQFDQFPTNVMVRTGSESYDSVIAALKNSFTDNPFETLRIEKVGPIVGKQLRKSATLAIIFALAAILIYVGFRFKHFDFAAAGVIALLHDILATIGVLLFLGREIDLLVITALLTIAGYSINDTIVIYDRVRENMGKLGKLSLAELINLSVNQTLGRTILTTSATMLAVLSLYFKGGEVLNTFSLALIIGFISGTYSTVFIASPLVLFWNKRLKKIS